MATIGTGALTLADWAKRLDPDGTVPYIVEVLNQKNEILQDMLWVEGNLPTGHQSTVRTGLPSVAWRLLNNGTAPSKSKTAQSEDKCGMLDAWSEVDCALAELNGNVAAFRRSEGVSFLEAMNKEFASTLFYGNAGLDPEEFTGLAPRYNSSTADNARNLILAGGAGSDNSSIWLIVWGEQSAHGIFPKGSKAGITQEDLGKVTMEVTAGVGGNRMRVYQEHWEWKCGVTLRDWRQVARIANIDISNLDGGSAADLRKLMVKAMHRIESLTMGRAAWYMNRTLLQYLDIQTIENVESGGGITVENVDGKPKMSFRGIPIRVCDALTETESLVS